MIRQLCTYVLLFFVLLECSAVFGSQNTRQHTNKSQSIFKSSTVLAGLGAGALLGAWIVHKNKAHLKEKRRQLKDYLIEYIGLPLYARYDRIKDEGISKEDLALAAGGVLMFYGAKKAGDRYDAWKSIRSLEASQKMHRQVAKDGAFLYEYKLQIGTGLGVLAALGWLIRAGWNLPIVERLRRSFTWEQKQLISSDEVLRDLVDNAHKDPVALHEHPHFSNQLLERQKKLLAQAVEEYKMEQDPMSLFEDFGDDFY